MYCTTPNYNVTLPFTSILTTRFWSKVLNVQNTDSLIEVVYWSACFYLLLLLRDYILFVRTFGSAPIERTVSLVQRYCRPCSAGLRPFPYWIMEELLTTAVSAEVLLFVWREGWLGSSSRRRGPHPGPGIQAYYPRFCPSCPRAKRGRRTSRRLWAPQPGCPAISPMWRRTGWVHGGIHMICTEQLWGQIIDK